MNARLPVLVTAGLLALGASSAHGQTPPTAAAGYKLKGGIATKKMRYYAPFQQVVLRGTVKPAVAGEVLTLYALRGGKATKKVRRRVRSGGRFAFGRLIDRQGTMVGLLPPGIGQRQIVVDNPAWLAVAEMLVRKL